MVRHPALCLLVLGLTCSLSQAADSRQQFPYQAVVVADEAEVRCGPGGQFYVTSQAPKNTQVTVHRHDHGGWYMIAPPPGSFSWIEAELVQRAGNDRGVVQLGQEEGQPLRALVRIGSQLGDEHSYYGRELRHGDEVHILGEKTLSTAQGNRRMLKITPPPQEFRWIKGELLVPLSAQIQQQIASDPYQVPARHRERLAAIRETTPAERQEPASRSRPKPLLAAPEGEATPAADPQFAADFSRLDSVDQRYAEMMQREPAAWDLEQITRDYQELSRSSSERIAALAEQRLGIVASRQEISDHYRRFIQIAGEAATRDAQILAHRTQLEDGSEAPPWPVSSPAVPGEMPAPQVAAQPVPLPAGPTTSEESSQPKLNGAGILHPTNAPPGVPNFILVSPDGRLLAYVDAAPEVQLQEWSGKPAGLIGERSHDADLQADRIVVRQVVPVQLVQ